MDKLETHKWQQIAEDWRHFIGPAKPSPEECIIFSSLIEKEIGKKKNAKVLMLGSTVEFRNILLKHSLENGAQVAALDINPAVYRGFGELVEAKNPLEKYVEGNWLDMPFKNESFDLVLGDHVIENIPYECREQLFGEVKRVLRKKGKFLLRVFAKTNRYKRYDLRASFGKYKRLYLDGEVSLPEAVNWFLWAFFQASYFVGEERLLKPGVYKKELRQMMKRAKDPASRLMLPKVFEWVGSMLEKKWTWHSAGAARNSLEKYFKLEKTAYANSAYYRVLKTRSPIYVLRKV